MKANLTEAEPDYGFDHYERDESGKVIRWKLVPSGRIVNQEQFQQWQAKRKLRPKPQDDCLGLSWDEIERKQGGKLNRNV